MIRGEYTKTKADRTIMLTQELTQQLKLWIDYKHRTRVISRYDKICNKTYIEKRTPKVNDELFIFSTKYNHNATVHGLYTNLLLMFENTIDRLGGKYAAYEHSKKRRKFTLHSFRRFVKTTISDLGHNEYSEYYIGHIGSTYYRVSETEKINLFKKIEPYLTFLDTKGLTLRHADLESKFNAIEQENKDLRENIKTIMEMIQQNPKLANVKPEVLTKKI